MDNQGNDSPKATNVLEFEKVNLKIRVQNYKSQNFVKMIFPKPMLYCVFWVFSRILLYGIFSNKPRVSVSLVGHVLLVNTGQGDSGQV